MQRPSQKVNRASIGTVVFLAGFALSTAPSLAAQKPASDGSRAMPPEELRIGLAVIEQYQEFEKSLAILRLWERHRYPNPSSLQTYADKQADRLGELIAVLEQKHAALRDNSKSNHTLPEVVKADPALLNTSFQIAADSIMDLSCPFMDRLRVPPPPPPQYRRAKNVLMVIDSVRYFRPCNAPGWTPVAALSGKNAIDPTRVMRVEVYRGPTAAILYGPDAANGVVVVTTR